ncbi:MAG: alpha/beta hydrolase [Elusimicrobiota bacterium]|jgi:pimeloyl-ACP methyl ester carboxylesterase
MKKRTLLRAGALLLVPAAFLLAWGWGHPAKVYEGAKRARLRLAGARPAESGGLRGWMRDDCSLEGDCRCVALVHGLGDSYVSWDALLSRRRPGTLIYAFNMPGTDGSQAPADPSGYGIRAQARTLRGALEPLCPRWTVVGNSLGGWISGWLALDWPQGVERLVLVGAAGVDDPSGSAESAARVLASPDVPKVREFMDKAYCRAPKLPEHILREIAARIAARPTKAITDQLSKKELLEKRLKSLRVPTEIVWGECDRILPVPMGETFKRLIPGSKLTVLPACGHIPQKECPDALQKVLFPS